MEKMGSIFKLGLVTLKLGVIFLGCIPCNNAAERAVLRKFTLNPDDQKLEEVSDSTETLIKAGAKFSASVKAGDEPENLNLGERLSLGLRQKITPLRNGPLALRAPPDGIVPPQNQIFRSPPRIPNRAPVKAETPTEGYFSTATTVGLEATEILSNRPSVEAETPEVEKPTTRVNAASEGFGATEMCRTNPCDPMQMCIPEEKQCVKEPCPQFKCKVKFHNQECGSQRDCGKHETCSRGKKCICSNGYSRHPDKNCYEDVCGC